MDIVNFNFKSFVHQLSNLTGVNLNQYRENYLKRRIDLRMQMIGITSYAEYLSLLKVDAAERTSLLNTITINVTEFMRDKTPFQYFMKHILPEIAKRKLETGSNLLRFWSAGCSYGEEPYSIAICVKETLGDKWMLSIYGTDIDEECLRFASEGIYSVNQLRNLNKKLIDRYFVNLGDGMYQVRNTIKSCVKFKKHDLTTEKPVSKYFDAVFCRNVMIYFTDAQKRKVLNDFYESLLKGGYLIIGKSETMPHGFETLFAPVNLKERVYVKI
ncbi:protein-glutamate O-methyltransferase CheR [Archaeoglobales archaeon]|nr:MAG: protein-glutamate O-methyltransferase CheR [Archaeoglobales archaeon]